MVDENVIELYFPSDKYLKAVIIIKCCYYSDGCHLASLVSVCRVLDK